MTKSFKVTTPFGTEVCTMSSSNYAQGNHIAIQLWCEDGPFATLTTNLAPKGTDKNIQAVDTNNCPWAPALIKRLKIGEPEDTTQPNTDPTEYVGELPTTVISENEPQKTELSAFIG